jgi:hypothetical protein
MSSAIGRHRHSPSTTTGVLVLDHRASGLVVRVVPRACATPFLHHVEVAFKFVCEMPHPLGRHVFLAQVLVPSEDGCGVGDRADQIAGDVFYAFASSRPESDGASSADTGSDEVKEVRLARESFPSKLSTIMFE